MKNTLSVLIGASTVVMLTCIAAAIGLATSDSQSDSTLIIATRDAQHRFTIEIARTPDEMERGLMFRDRLPPDHGMLFLYEDDRRVSFWMKNTLIPLDIIFIRPDGTIARIAANTTPMSLEPIPSLEPVSAVLEIAGGRAAELGISEGDRVEW
jgi:uncharacterized membrane protein (UPF0127 family)